MTGGSWDDPILLTGSSGSFAVDCSSAFWGTWQWLSIAAPLVTQYHFRITSDYSYSQWIGYTGPDEADRNGIYYHDYPYYTYYGYRKHVSDGSPYHFKVMNISGGPATYINFEWYTDPVPPPGPYTFASATTLDCGESGSVHYTNLGYGGEEWFKLNLEVGRAYTFLSDEHYGYFELYSGDGPQWSGLHYLDYGSMDDRPQYNTPLFFTALAGVHYSLVVYPNDPTTSSNLTWTSDPPVVPPAYITANDRFADAQVINVDTAGSVAWDNTGCSGETAAPMYESLSDRTIWFTFTPSATRDVIFTLDGPVGEALSGKDTFRALYLNLSGNLQQPAAHWDNNFYQGGEIIAAAGVQHWIQLSFPYGNQGLWAVGTLSWRPKAIAPNAIPSGALSLNAKSGSFWVTFE